MLQRLLSVLVVSVAVAAPAFAEGPAIEHQPVACVVAGRFPQLTASFTPGDAVARARVLFQPESGRHWYGVAMKPTGSAFSAILPKPKKSLKSYRYYLEVTDTALGTSRTAEHSTTVAAGAAACADKKVAGGLGSAAVRLEVPAGAPSVPGGFSANGVIAVGAAVAVGATTAAAAGGGMSTAVLIGAGLAVAGAGVAVAASAGGGGDGGGVGGGASTSASYEGPFNGQFSITLFYAEPDARGSFVVCTGTSSLAGTATLTLDNAGGAVNGTIQTSGTHTAISGMCPKGFSVSWTAPLTGSTGSIAARSEASFTSPGPPATTTSNTVFEFAGALSGGAITGVLTFTYSEQAVDDRGKTFSGSASVALPVTLRQR